MRIKSKFQDYYDGVQAFGHDTTLTYVRTHVSYSDKEFEGSNPSVYEAARVYLRKTATIDLANPAEQTQWGGSYHLSREPFLVGFCGELYCGLRHVEEFTYLDNVYHNFYSTEDIKHFLKSKAKYKYGLKRFNEDVYSRWRGHNKRIADAPVDVYNKYFDVGNMENKDTIKSLFTKYKTPIFVILWDNGIELHTNPCMKDFSLFKKVDTFSAFQEIDMYLGGVLGVDAPEMATISDEDMKVKKGFNDWSFKTRPTKRKK